MGPHCSGNDRQATYSSQLWRWEPCETAADNHSLLWGLPSWENPLSLTDPVRQAARISHTHPGTEPRTTPEGPLYSGETQ